MKVLTPLRSVCTPKHSPRSSIRKKRWCSRESNDGNLRIQRRPVLRVFNGIYGDAICRELCNRCSCDRKAAESNLSSPEVTRFKGLGEISPREFGQFIGPDARLLPVNVSQLGEVGKCLDFFMGKNTPERKSFIMENLSTDVL